MEGTSPVDIKTTLSFHKPRCLTASGFYFLVNLFSNVMHKIFLIAALILLIPNAAYAYTQKYTSTGRLVRWNRSEIELTVIRVDSCRSCPDETEVVGSLQRAASTWNEIPTSPTINIIERSGNSEWGIDGVNGVYFVRDWPFSFRALAITLTSYNENTGELIDTDVIINGEMPFGLSGERNQYDLDTVLTHELGHVLGLDESSVPGATMFPNTRRGETDRRELSTDDVDGILSIYQTVPTPGCNITRRKTSFNGSIIFLILLLLVRKYSSFFFKLST